MQEVGHPWAGVAAPRQRGLRVDQLGGGAGRDGRGGDGPSVRQAEQVALDQVGADPAQRGQLGFGLHAHSDQLCADTVRELPGRLQQRRASRLVGQPGHHASVQLQQLGGDLGEQGERRVGVTQAVEREPEAGATQHEQAVEQVLAGRPAERRADLQHHVGRPTPGGPQRVEERGQQLGRAGHGEREQVDVQRQQRLVLGSRADGGGGQRGVGLREVPGAPGFPEEVVDGPRGGAGEGLHRDDAAGVQVEQRLVGKADAVQLCSHASILPAEPVVCRASSPSVHAGATRITERIGSPGRQIWLNRKENALPPRCPTIWAAR